MIKRFGCATSEGILFVIANSLKRNKTFVCKYNTKNWKLMTCKQVHNKPITAFTIRYFFLSSFFFFFSLYSYFHISYDQK